MPLTANREVDHYVDQELRTYQIAAGKHIFKGAFVGLNAAGYAQPLIAGDPFVGLAYEEMDNSGGLDAALGVRVYTLGDFGFTLTGATVAHIGRPVFASADNVLTFAGAGNSYLGVVQDVLTANEIILRLDTARAKVKTVTHAVENLSAGADVAARAIHAFDADGWLVSARVVNQSTAPAGINDANTCVIALATDAGTVVSATFNTGAPFPAANSEQDLGALANTHVEPGQVLTAAVTNGATADPGPFLIQVDYV